MKYPHLTRILSAQFPKLKIDETTRDLNKIGMLLVNGKPVTNEEFLTMKNPKVNRDLDLMRNKEIYSLPEGLEVGGDLNLSFTKITSLPKGLKVGGSLLLSGTNITSLPEGLEVRGNLYLMDTNITSLPEGLKVGGIIYVRDPSKIQCSEKLGRLLVEVGNPVDENFTDIISKTEVSAVSEDELFGELQIALEEIDLGEYEIQECLKKHAYAYVNEDESPGREAENFFMMGQRNPNLRMHYLWVEQFEETYFLDKTALELIIKELAEENPSVPEFARLRNKITKQAKIDKKKV